MAVNTLFSDKQQDEDEAQLGADSPEPERRSPLQHFWQRATLSGPDYPSRRAAVQRTFLVLLGMSALFGGMAGLAVVYSIDLPQMEDLAKYRPNTTTELLDVKGREIGSFALERRVVVPYSDIPVSLKDAILSIEDKHFETNWGKSTWHARRRQRTQTCMSIAARRAPRR